jgi:cytochrome c oxidase subunit IV
MSAHTTTHAGDTREPKIYGAVLVALLILTGITVGASYVHFGSGMANVVIALTIATVKATLVGLFFMHLAHDRPINAFILITSLSFVGLLLILSYADVATRDEYRPSNLKVAPAPAAAKPVAGTPASAPAGAPVHAPAATPASAPAH